MDEHLIRRQSLTRALIDSPYDLVLYLRRAQVHLDLRYPDLAAGDAYRALLLADEAAAGEWSEYHERAVAALRPHIAAAEPLLHGVPPPPRQLQSRDDDDDGDGDGDGDDDGDDGIGPATHAASLRAFRILASSLLFCGCLASGLEFCRRGLRLSPGDEALMAAKEHIREAAAAAAAAQSPHNPADDDADWAANLPDSGLVRREMYPWNDQEPDRFSAESLAYLNAELASMAPKCEVRVTTLPVLDGGGSSGGGGGETCRQLGLFAKEAIAPGEAVLREYSLLTAGTRPEESPACDACRAELPPLDDESAPPPVSCPECGDDAVFCDQFCLGQALERYHPAVCGRDVEDAVAAGDPDPRVADSLLYLLLLGRVLAMALHQGVHPLRVREISHIWADFRPPSPPSAPTLPFSFRHHIAAPLHVLEKMDVDVYATVAAHDVWVFNTIYAKLRATASALRSSRDGAPKTAAVHPLWCLANHDCDPNVRWEWRGCMSLAARETRVIGGEASGLRPGDEVLSHYCDVDLPVQERREWARGALGGMYVVRYPSSAIYRYLCYRHMSAEFRRPPYMSGSGMHST